MALAAAAAAVFDVGAAAADPSVSPFAGNWSGTWSALNYTEDGTLAWTVSDAGRLSGRVFHAQDGEIGWGEIRGHVRADGTFEMVAFAPADDHEHGNGVPHQGTVELGTDSRLYLSFTSTFSGGITVVAVLAPN
jgi:hypothetical protein